MNKLIACVALGGLVPAPSMASVRMAAYSQSSDMNVAQPSIFAGATYRVGFDRKSGTTKGRASLKLAGMTATPERGQFYFGEGLELTGGQRGKPVLRLSGREVGQLTKRTNMSSSGKIAVVVGVVALVGAVAVGVWALDASYCDRHECE